MVALADLLLHATNARKDLYVRLGDRLVRFTHGLEVGRAVITDDKTLVLTSNYYDLAELAEDLRQLAAEPIEEHHQHIHIGQPDGAFMNASETVHDIVFEFRDGA